MSIGTVIGLALGVVTVFVAMILKGISFTVLLNPAAAVVIFGGTISAVIVATPGFDLKNTGKLFGVLFGKERFPKKEVVIKRLLEYATKARQEGFLALEASISQEPDPFLSRCLSLLVDGSSKDVIEETLIQDVEAMQERHAGNATIFSQAGTYAPTLGVLGAVLGLVAAMGALSDTEALSHAIAAAFIATVLGIFTGYVMWNPMANRLRRKSNMEVQVKMMIIKGVCDISAGKNLPVIKENLLAYVTRDEQKKMGVSEG
jgi:chemotaxis protein MotA